MDLCFILMQLYGFNLENLCPPDVKVLSHTSLISSQECQNKWKNKSNYTFAVTVRWFNIQFNSHKGTNHSNTFASYKLTDPLCISTCNIHIIWMSMNWKRQFKLNIAACFTISGYINCGLLPIKASSQQNEWRGSQMWCNSWHAGKRLIQMCATWCTLTQIKHDETQLVEQTHRC